MSTGISNPNLPHPGKQGNFYDRLNVKQKLNLVITLMTAGILMVFVFALGGALAVNYHISNIYDFSVVPTNAIANTETALVDMQIYIVALQSNDLSPEEQSTYFAAIENSQEIVSTTIETYRSEWMRGNDPAFSNILREQNQLTLLGDEFSALQKLTAAYNDFPDTYTLFKEELQQGIPNNELASASTSALRDARTHLNRLSQINIQFAEISHEAATDNNQDNVLRLFLSMIFAVVFGISVSVATTKSISERLNSLESTASAMEDGYVDRRTYFAISGKDEISRLGNVLSRLFNRLQETLTGLEERVERRTASLAIATQDSEKRARLFEAITLVGRVIASIRSLDDLLPKVTEVISQQFGYYHTGIFLNDAANENTVLSAANSEGGQRMLKRGHQLKIGAQGIVGYATGTGKARIALDVGEDAVYFDNPDMPETRSELALPLKIGDSVIGALDVQSKESAAFTDEDINVLTLLADQVSMAIENARLFDQARKSLVESEALYRQYIRQAWGRLPKEQDLAGFKYSIQGTIPLRAKDSASEAPIAASDMEKESPEGQSPQIAVPITIRGETIGTLSVRIPQAKVLSQNQVDLVNAIAERVALSAENARLFEETTRRAERERLVSDITVKIRGSNDPDVMIQTALNELKGALGATHVELVPHTLQKSNEGQETTIPKAEAFVQKVNKREGDEK